MTPSVRADTWRAAPVRIPLLVGGTAVIAGGLVAAATAPAPSEHGSWAAAYLVLVVGVAQLGLAAGIAWLADPAPAHRLVRAEFLIWNLGNAAVLAGTLLDVQAVVDAGGALIVLALLVALLVVRPSRPSWLLWAYRALVVVVLVSVPIGLVLARVRSG